MLKIAVDSIERIPGLTALVVSRRSAVQEVAAWLGDLCDSSVLFDLPFSYEGWADKIHPVVVEQPRSSPIDSASWTYGLPLYLPNSRKNSSILPAG